MYCYISGNVNATIKLLQFIASTLKSLLHLGIGRVDFSWSRESPFVTMTPKKQTENGKTCRGFNFWNFAKKGDRAVKLAIFLRYIGSQKSILRTEQTFQTYKHFKIKSVFIIFNRQPDFSARIGDQGSKKIYPLLLYFLLQLRQGQSYCTDNECLEELPGLSRPESAGNSFLVMFLMMALAAAMYMMRPRRNQIQDAAKPTPHHVCSVSCFLQNVVDLFSFPGK